MRSDNFDTWKADMIKQGLYDSISAITSATPAQYWAYATACNFFKKVQMNALDTHLANQLFEDVEGAWLPGNPSILPLPGPDDFPFPVLTPYDPGPFLPTEVFYHQMVVTAEGGPGEGLGGVPRSTEELADFTAKLWGLPLAVAEFQALAATQAIKVNGVATTVYDFLDQVGGGNWPELYTHVKLALAGQKGPAVAYFRARFEEMPEGGASWESYGAAIGAAVGAAAGAATSWGAGTYVGGAAGGCAGATIGSWFD